MKRGTPAVMHATSDHTSPCLIASRQVFIEPPIGASTSSTSASLPGRRKPLFNPYTLATLPVAAAIIHSGGYLESVDISVTDLIMPSGIMPVPVGVSVAI